MELARDRFLYSCAAAGMTVNRIAAKRMVARATSANAKLLRNRNCCSSGRYAKGPAGAEDWRRKHYLVHERALEAAASRRRRLQKPH